MSGQTYNVSNATDLADALAHAKGGDTISLASGNYGDVALNGLHFTSDVTITAASPTADVSFNTLKLTDSSNITMNDIHFDFKPTATTVEWDSALRVDSSANITVQNSTFSGGDAVAGIPNDSAPGTQGASGITGEPIARAMTFNWCQNITITNNEVIGFNSGVRVASVDGLTLTNNDIHGFRMVPIGGGDVSNVLLQGNYLHDAEPWKFGALGDHGDFIHFWTTPEQTTPSSNFVFTGNFISQGDGTAVLGIYMDNNTNPTGFTNVLIENNVILNGNAQGLRIEDVNGLVVRQNTLVQSSGGPQDAPQMYLDTGTHNVIITGNIYAGANGPAFDHAVANNITLSGNYLAQTQDPLGAHYVGDILVNALADNPSLADMQIIPGTVPAGTGAPMTVFDTTPDTLSGYIADSHDTGLNITRHHFDASNVYGSLGKVSLTGARIEWDFGDGQKATGLKADHQYLHGGDYVATATITLASGQVVTLDKALAVVSPYAIHANFDTGAKDLSDVPNDTLVTGNVSFEKSDLGTSIRITSANSAVTFLPNAEILNNPDFSISMAFKKDVGAEHGGGRMLYVSGGAVLDIADDTITLRGKNDKNETISLYGKGVGIADHNWHQVTYTSSKTDGTAILYVDGHEVARMSGLTGGEYVTPSHGLQLGTPFGTSFSGLMDNLDFVRAALSPADVAQQFTDFQNAVHHTIPAIPADTTPPPDPAPGPAPFVLPEIHGYLMHLDAMRPASAPALPTTGAAPVEQAQLMGDAHVIQVGGQTEITFDGHNDYVKIGRLTQYEKSEQVAFSVDFSRAVADGSTERLVWNHMKLGLTLSGDGFILNAGTATEGFKSFTVKNLGLNDTDLHKAYVMIDNQSDHLQVFIDGKLVMDETHTDFKTVGAGGNEWGWTLGSAWNSNFAGEVHGFQVGDTVHFDDLPLDHAMLPMI